MLDEMGKQRQLKLQADLERLEAEKAAERLRMDMIKKPKVLKSPPGGTRKVANSITVNSRSNSNLETTR